MEQERVEKQTEKAADVQPTEANKTAVQPTEADKIAKKHQQDAIM